MKKLFLFITSCFIFLSFSYSQKKLSDLVDEESLKTAEVQVQNPDGFFVSNNVPKIFDGIWEGDDRYIMFQEKSELEEIIQHDASLSDSNYIWIYLKTFYGWYVDRAAEKTNRKNSKYAYDKNNTVFRQIQNIKIQFKPLINLDNCCAFEIIISYPQIKEPTIIPVCVINENLYLDFAIKTSEFSQNENDFEKEKNPLTGSWSAVGKVNGIKVSKPIVSDELTSTYITEDSIYYIRYWKTNMDYSSDKAYFFDGLQKYEVPKHIQSSGKIYTCVNGRSVTIRNVQRKSLPLENFVMNDDCNVIAFGKPYLKRILKNCSLESMMKIVKTSNSRKAHDYDPPFPPAQLDWHLEDIKRVELNNQIIQAVRRRQREFYEKYGLGLHY